MAKAKSGRRQIVICEVQGVKAVMGPYDVSAGINDHALLDLKTSDGPVTLVVPWGETQEIAARFNKLPW